MLCVCVFLSHLTLNWCLQYVGSIIQDILLLTIVLFLFHLCLHRRAIYNTSATILIKLKTKNWNTERFCIIFVDMMLMRTSRENSIEQLSSSASSSNSRETENSSCLKHIHQHIVYHNVRNFSRFRFHFAH